MSPFERQSDIFDLTISKRNFVQNLKIRTSFFASAGFLSQLFRRHLSPTYAVAFAPQLIDITRCFLLLQPRQNLLSAAGRVGEASHDIMKQVGDEDDVDKAFQVLTVIIVHIQSLTRTHTHTHKHARTHFSQANKTRSCADCGNAASDATSSQQAGTPLM